MRLLDPLRKAKHYWFVVRKRSRWAAKGVTVAATANVHDTCDIDPGSTIGDGTFINWKVKIDSMVTIGDRVAIGAETYFCTYNHEIGDHSRRAGAHFPEPIVVEDGCWIGARVLVLPGVTIAEGCVIAAGAVVASDTEPDGLYAGVPAKRVKDLP